MIRPPWDGICKSTFGLKLEITSPVPLSDVIRNKNMQWKPLADVTLSLSPKFSFLHGWQALECRRELGSALARPVVHVSASGLADAGKGSNCAGFLGRVALAGGERREF